MSKGREFWIFGGEFSECSSCEDDAVQVLSHNPKDPCTHVIEYSAYTSALAQIAKLEAALGFYGDKSNWNYTGMYNKADSSKYIGPNCDFYDAYKNITNDDLEEHNETMRFGGKRARLALSSLAEWKKERGL